MEWDTVIGLEVHAQLKTKSKLFSGSSTNFGSHPNSQTSFIDAGLPGVLPVVNHSAITMAIQFGFAINAQINNFSYFERKNYFYPDLPKGYQISQFQSPIVSHGQLAVDMGNGTVKQVEIVRAHLEEDAGKSIHDAYGQFSGIDLNRAGTPLLEIVTAPCLYSAEEAVNYLKTLHQLVRFLGICDGNMQEGSFRCDVNISIKPKDSTKLGTRTEIKNLNSFRFIEKAIAYEQARHQELLEEGQKVIQETRLFNPDTETTHVMRSKENENDYRYFPDPDLLPIHITQQDLDEVKTKLPLLPEQIKSDLRSSGVANEDEIQFLLTTPAHFEYYQAVVQHTEADNKAIINWMKGTLSAALNDKSLNFDQNPIPARELGSLLTHLHKKSISNSIAKQIFSKLWENKAKSVETIIAEEGYEQIQDDSILINLIKELISQHPQQAQDYRNGKTKLLGFFVGLVMKQTKGQANPELVNQLLIQLLEA